MKKSGIIGATLVLIMLTLYIPAYAFGPVPTIMNTDQMKVGSWVKMLQQTGNKKVKTWVGTVGKEIINGKKYVWMEMRIKNKSMTVITKMLVRANMNKNAFDLKRIIVKQDGKPAIELPPQMAAMAGGMVSSQMTGKNSNKTGNMQVIGKETVTVPAGTFLTTHIRLTSKDGSRLDIWQTNKVSIGAVKMISSNGSKSILLAYGTGAKSAITEKPKVMNIPIKK